MVENLQVRKLDISALKHRFLLKYAKSELSTILPAEPDELTPESLISKTGTWLAILDAERKGRYKYLNEQIKGDAQWG